MQVTGHTPDTVTYRLRAGRRLPSFAPVHSIINPPITPTTLVTDTPSSNTSKKRTNSESQDSRKDPPSADQDSAKKSQIVKRSRGTEVSRTRANRWWKCFQKGGWKALRAQNRGPKRQAASARLSRKRKRSRSLPPTNPKTKNSPSSPRRGEPERSDWWGGETKILTPKENRLPPQNSDPPTLHPLPFTLHPPPSWHRAFAR